MPASTAGTSSAARDRQMQHTFRVLQTLRSSDPSTAAASFSRSADADAKSHAPPVPCRLAGTPACRASAPSVATAGPDPRATASARRLSPARAQPEECDALSIRDTAPAGKPASAKATSRACFMIARAVPRASLPIRNTTVLPPRSTPVASASTFGLPSNTNPTTPRAEPTRSTDQPSCCTVSSTWPRRLVAGTHPRSPSIMPRRSFSDATSRVVDRPRPFAASTSCEFAASITDHVVSSSSFAAKRSKKSEICASVTRPISEKAARALSTASAVAFLSAAGKCRTSPVPSMTRTASPG
mmetsp:Transcript_73463/g.215472  ORF Transcript_73463/g.215472 Transcript_73463/m.215472 type:complete len:299 (-) Transcript_73463:146-1042(-)